MVQAASVALHVGAICAMSYGYNALHSLSAETWISNQYGGHFQFLTIQGLAVAWLTMAVGLLEDFFPVIKGLRSIKRTLFMAGMPIATMVSSIYWTLLLTNPHLILQAIPGEPGEASTILVLPLRIDLALHAVPCLALLADFMIFEHRYGRKAILYAAPAITLICTLWYASWVEHCATKNRTFPYPFLTLNPFEIRLRIYAATGTLACLSLYALNALHPKSR
ncbi:FAR-17a/AIG1-like protein [Mycena maculata]|uniref:FAR-17a/AIG1-like protein n=1 Tax=Mycena maculata TaxID=230809 RepID=A0AAD7N0W1_9AGAR|nr:FAR-17a/AIG1-like protein [Mycena maculata]